MSEQQDSSALDAESGARGEDPQTRIQHERDRERKLPQETVASLIAERLDVRDDEEAIRTRIHQLVRTFGRTQALSLCTQVIASEVQENVGKPEQFFVLVEAKGIPKQQRRWQDDKTRQKTRDPEREHKPDDEGDTVAQMIAEQLDEKLWTARHMILLSVHVLGVETALALLQETQDKEAAGGIMLPDGSRRRTPGGVYFLLVKQATSAGQQQQIFGHVVGTPRGERVVPQTPPQAPPAPPMFSWSERHPILQEADKEKGEIRTVKITLIGRPKTVVERGQCFVMSMQQGPTIPSLPKGLPLPPKVEATIYTVYIASKQWRKVTEALKDQADVLIVEGWPMMDTKEGRIAVFANSVTTKNLQIAQKQAPLSLSTQKQNE